MLTRTYQVILNRLRAYWTLIKSLQTGLLLITGLTGYMSGRCPVMAWQTLLAVTGSLFLAIGGSTVLNMVYDRDIDAKMERACRRPLPSGQVSVSAALVLGIVLVALGVSWAFILSPLYGAIVFAGAFFDVVVYTLWLKRRTAYSIVIGGLSGGMPALAGRTLAVGGIDAIGVFLALAVLLWIPTHIMPFNMRHEEDYRRAGIPTFLSTYGSRVAGAIVTVSSVGVAVAMTAVAIGIGMAWGYLWLLSVLSAGLLGLAILSLIRPSDRLILRLFKYASVYMLSSMLLVAVEAI